MVEQAVLRDHGRRFISEFIGTFFLVVFGNGSVNAAALTGDFGLQGAGQVMVVWGFGCTLAIFLSAQTSGGHINPAISAAFALVRPKLFSPWYLPTYWAAQTLGGFIASLFNFGIWSAWLRYYEDTHDAKRGSMGSRLTAMTYGGYFPNPQLPMPQEYISGWYAFGVEMWMTAILAFMVFALTDKNNKAVPKGAAPFFIGFTIALLVGLYESLTLAIFNPARDFGPRLVAYMMGWGPIAIPGPRKRFFVYIFAPLIGGPIGGALYHYVLAPVVRMSLTNDDAPPQKFHPIAGDHFEQKLASKRSSHKSIGHSGHGRGNTVEKQGLLNDDEA